MTVYWLDTEFIEDGITIDLISIGIVSDDGREYYACNDECDLNRANEWVKKHVLPQLPSKHSNIDPGSPDVSPSVREEILTWKLQDKIASDIIEFCNPQKYGKPVFWGYYADHDWVVFCQLFGTMMDLPKEFPMYCCDIKQWCDMLGNPKLPEQGKGEHHALTDARHNKLMWEFLKDYENSK